MSVVVGYYDPALNRSIDEEFETEAEAQDYINSLSACTIPYTYDLDAANAQLLAVDEAEQKYYDQLAAREAQLERESREELEESYEMEI